jgi:hypothetical protein
MTTARLLKRSEAPPIPPRLPSIPHKPPSDTGELERVILGLDSETVGELRSENGETITALRGRLDRLARRLEIRVRVWVVGGRLYFVLDE